jgi:hypothetical protein
MGGRIGMHIEYWWESQKDRDHWEVGGQSEKGSERDRMGWYGLD